MSNWKISVQKDKNNFESFKNWAKLHQEFIAILIIVILIIGIGLPYYLNSVATNNKKSMAMLNMGIYYLNAPVGPQSAFKTEVEKYQECSTFFNKVKNLYPGTQAYNIAYYYLGKCDLFLQNYMLASKYFKLAYKKLKNTPLGQEAFIGVGMCYISQSQWNPAILIFEKYLKIYPNGFLREEARFNLAKIDKLVHNLAMAKIELKKIIHSHPNSDWAKQASFELKTL